MTTNRPPEDLLREALVGDGCPEPAEWHLLASGQADEATAWRLAEHARTCPSCSVEERLAELFEEPIAEDDSEVRTLVAQLRSRNSQPVSSIEARRGAAVVEIGSGEAAPLWRRYALAAAIVVTMVGAGIFLSRQSEPPPVGAPGDGALMRGRTVELVAPLGELDAPPATFTWGPVPGATAYRVELTRVDGRSIWTAEVTAAPVALPADVRAALRPAVTYRWRVTSLSAAGGEKERSANGEFQIRPGLEAPPPGAN